MVKSQVYLFFYKSIMKLKKLIPLLTIIGFALYKIRSKTNRSDIDPNNIYVVVTGASTGIGKAIAEKLAEVGYNVFATVRKDTDADILAGLSPKITPIKMDVTDHDSILKAKETIKELLGDKKLYSLINNAGIAVAGPLEVIDIEEIRKQFEVNYFGLLDTTQVFFELLDKGHSKIINMSSVGGKIATPFMGPYNSSKFALEAMSDSMRRELFDTNIEVVVIEPGMIMTPIWDKAEEIDVEKYKSTTYVPYLKKLKTTAIDGGRKGAPASKVADRVLEVLSKKSNKARYWVSANPAVEVYIPRMIPAKLLDFAVGKMLKS